jgi:hypothetical protein
MDVNGGQITISTPWLAVRPGNSSDIKTLASAAVSNIFQFPATNGRRIFTSTRITGHIFYPRMTARSRYKYHFSNQAMYGTTNLDRLVLIQDESLH